ncbi:DUF1775 domain-containing protein [Aeromicrobium sp. Sec7.5]|uniref:DUF1775 domain-containing protein n=1 Tax=Aeromicrobium sp. Sec7.5 TaxID=3121276 RepID=UPI002FE46F65
MTRTSIRGSAVVTVLTFLLWCGVAPASAHVLLEQAVPLGDGSVELTITFDHSCDASPTVELSVEVPEGAEIVGGTGPDGWTATPGGSRVVFTGPGIGDGASPRFTVVARLTGSVGQTLLFPTRQTCADGDGYDWADSSESEERPAPRLIATEAVLADVVSPAAAPAPAALPDEGASATQLAIMFTVLAGAAYVVSRALLAGGRAGSR